MNPNPIVGILSDTHGHLPPFVQKGFEKINVAHIIHAGDIGDIALIQQLQKIAPVTWVHGNMDHRRIGTGSAVAEVSDIHFYVLHNIYDLDIDPPAAGMGAVIHGHLHIPRIEWKNDVLYINPGSCVQPRGGHPPSYAIIEIRENRLFPRIIFEK